MTGAAVVALAMGSAVVSPAPVRAATPSTPYVAAPLTAPVPQAFATWGLRMAGAALPGPGGAPAAGGDLNGDGVNDAWVAEPSLRLPGTPRGRIFAIDGKAAGEGRTVALYAIANPRPGDFNRFPSTLGTIGDLDGDGVNDLAAGVEFEVVNGTFSVGEAWTFSGRDGHLLKTLANPITAVGTRFGARVGRAGDINGDGVPDVLVGAPGTAIPNGCDRDGSPVCSLGQGRAFIFDGSTGALLRTLDMPAEDVPPGGCGFQCNFGNAVQGPGDVDGDGVTDQLVGASQYNNQVGRMYLFSGRTGALLRKMDPPEPQTADGPHFGGTFGFQDVAPLSPGDVNHDGRADVYGASFGQNGPAGEEQGKAWVFDGSTGAMLYALDDPTPERGGQFGWSMAATDYNHDGTPDLYVGEAPHDIANPEGCSFDGEPRCVNRGTNGGTAVFDGRSGAPLRGMELPPPYNSCTPEHCHDLLPALGWSLAAPGDLNGDGEPDYLAGAPYAQVGANDSEGVVIAFLSAGTRSTLAVSPSPARLGAPVTFTDTVCPVTPASSATPPTGTVTFSDAGNVLGTATLAPGGGTGCAQASLAVSSLSAGQHAVTAVYSGDANHLGSTARLVSVIAGCATTISGPVGSLDLSEGSWCLNRASVNGSLTIRPGAAVSIAGSSVSGPVTSNGAATVQMCGSRLFQGLVVRNSTGFVLVGDPGDDRCAPNAIFGPVVLDANHGAVEVSSNSLSSSLTVNGTTGSGPFAEDQGAEIEANHIQGGLSCAGNAPPPTNDGHPNTVGGTRSGQCSSPGF